MTSYADAYVCPLVKSTGKPDAGNPHVRFDEGEGYALPTLLANLLSAMSFLFFFACVRLANCGLAGALTGVYSQKSLNEMVSSGNF